MCQFLSRNMGGERKSGKWHQETDQEEEEGREGGKNEGKNIVSDEG